MTLGFDEFKGQLMMKLLLKEVANIFNTSHTTKIIDKNLFESKFLIF